MKHCQFLMGFEWDKYHLPTGAGSRNHARYISFGWFEIFLLDHQQKGFHQRRVTSGYIWVILGVSVCLKNGSTPK